MTVFTDLGVPQIAGDGLLSLPGSVVAPGIDDANNTALWAGTLDTLHLIAREGAPAPGTEAGTCFGDFNSAGILCRNGAVAFSSALKGPAVNDANNIGIWSTSGGLHLAAREGNLIGGSSAFYITPYRFNDLGDLMFAARVGRTDSVCVEQGGSVTLVAPKGQSFQHLDPYGFNTSRQVPLLADSRNLWIAENGSLRRIATQGGALPDIDYRYNGFFRGIRINNAGQLSFTTDLLRLDNTSVSALLMEEQGRVHPILLGGDPAPGMPAGYVLGSVEGNYLGLTQSGSLAFRGALASGPGVTTSNNEGIWAGRPGSMHLVLRKGEQAAGTPDGTTFKFEMSFPRLATSEAGNTAVYCALQGPGVDSRNMYGLWGEDAAGRLTLIAREGDLFPVAPGDLRPIIKVSREAALDDFGRVAFQCEFADGSRGAFVWIPTPVPEPGTLVLLAATLAAALGWAVVGRGRACRARRRNILLLWAVAASGLSRAEAAVTTMTGNARAYQTIALLGRPAPGLPAGVCHAASFGAAQIRADGRVAFRGMLMGPGIHSLIDSVVWAGSPGALEILAREGDLAPGTVGDVRFGSMGNLSGLNEKGQLLISAPLLGPSVVSTGTFPDNAGIWRAAPGQMELLVRLGDPAPGAGAGARFTSFTGTTRLNASGQAMFLANAKVGASGAEGLWLGAPGDMTALAVPNVPVPGMDGVTFTRYVGGNECSFFDKHTAFFAQASGAGFDPANTVLWSGTTDALKTLAQWKQQAPGMSDGVTLSSLPYNLCGNAAGQVTFTGGLTDPGITESNTRIRWAGSQDDLQVVAREGDPVPGTSTGTYFGTPWGSALIGAGGHVAAAVRLSEPGVNSGNDSAVLIGFPSEPQLLAREGGPAPGTSPYVYFDSFTNVAAVNASGNVAFTANLRGYNVSDNSDESLWVADPVGNLEVVVREGDLFDVGGGDWRTVKVIQVVTGTGNDGRPTCLNDRGQIVFNLTFEDSTTGVFMTTVPEPSAGILLFGGLVVLALAALRRRRKRRGLLGAVLAIALPGVAGVADASPLPGDQLLAMYSPWPTAPGWDQGYGTCITSAGGKIVVGVPYDDPFEMGNAGALYVYNGGTGAFLRRILNANSSQYNNFGKTAAALGDRVIACSPLDYSAGSDGVMEGGRAFLYDLASGSPVSTLSHPSPRYQAHFGDAVAALGDDILVGTPGYSAGSAYLFDGQSENLIRELPNPNPHSLDWFGQAVAGVGSKALIGAPGFDVSADAGQNVGRAYLFDKSGALLAAIDNPEPIAVKQFGTYLTAVGDNFAITGGDKVYLYDGVTYGLLKTIVNPEPKESASFGRSLAGVGDNLLVGGWGLEAAYLFDGHSGDLLLTLHNPDPTYHPYFGRAVGAMDGNLLVAARDIAYVYQGVPEPGTLTLLGAVALGLLGWVWRTKRGT